MCVQGRDCVAAPDSLVLLCSPLVSSAATNLDPPCLFGDPGLFISLSKLFCTIDLYFRPLGAYHVSCFTFTSMQKRVMYGEACGMELSDWEVGPRTPLGNSPRIIGCHK